MTHDLDRVPVWQASPLDLLRMLWRLWRARQEDPLVYHRALHRRSVAWSLGVFAAWPAYALFCAVAVPWMYYWGSPKWRALPPHLFLLAGAAMAFIWVEVLRQCFAAGRLRVTPELLESLRTTTLGDREIVFGILYPRMRWLAMLSVPLLAMVLAISVTVLLSSYVRDIEWLFDWRAAFNWYGYPWDPFALDTPFDVVGAITLAALLPVIGAGAIVEAHLPPGEPAWRRIIRPMLAFAVTALALHAVSALSECAVAFAAEAKESLRPEIYPGSSDRFWDGGAAYAAIAAEARRLLLAHAGVALLIAIGTVRRACLLASERLFAPLDPPRLAERWWRRASPGGDAPPPPRPFASAGGFGVAVLAAAAAIVAVHAYRSATPYEDALIRISPRFPDEGEQVTVTILRPGKDHDRVLTRLQLREAWRYPQDTRGTPAARFATAGDVLVARLPVPAATAPLEGALQFAYIPNEYLSWDSTSTRYQVPPSRRWLHATWGDMGTIPPARAYRIGGARYGLRYALAHVLHPLNAVAFVAAAGWAVGARHRGARVPTRRAALWLLRAMAPALGLGFAAAMLGGSFALAKCPGTLAGASPAFALLISGAWSLAATSAGALLGVLAGVQAMASGAPRRTMLGWAFIVMTILVTTANVMSGAEAGHLPESWGSSPHSELLAAAFAFALLAYRQFRDGAFQGLHDRTAPDREGEASP